MKKYSRAIILSVLTLAVLALGNGIAEAVPLLRPIW